METILNQRELDFIESLIAKDPKYGGVEANNRLILAAAEHTDLSRLSETVVRGIIIKLTSQNQLAVNGNYHQAFQTFFASHPELNLQANERILCNAIQLVQGATVSAENLETCITRESIRQQLTTTQFSQAEVAREHAALQGMIGYARDAGNKVLDLTQYLIGPDGEPKGRTVYDKALMARRLEKETSELLALSHDELNTRHEQWAYKKRLEGMTASEVREIVKQDDLQRRAGYTQYRPVPASYSPPNKETVFIPWSQQLLTKLPASELARLIQIYGDKALSAAAAQGATR